jgi:proteasome accessory factor C
VDLQVDGDRVYIRFADQFRRPVRLTPREAMAVEMALAGWQEEAGGPFAEAVASIREKVRMAYAPELAEDVQAAQARIAAVSPVGLAGRMLRELKDALALQVEVRMEYFSRSSGGLSTRVVRPYGIYERAGRWYLVAYEVEKGEVRTFRADRIRSAELLDLEYEIPDEFEVADLQAEAHPDPESPAIEVTVRFDPDYARYVREDLPASRSRTLPDGSLRATLKVTGEAWLLGELLRWGGHAVVEDPPEFAERLARRAARVLEMYGGETDGQAQ